MAKPAFVIEPIDFDVATRAVEKFSQERKIPSMVFPGNGVGEGATRTAAESTNETQNLAALRKQRSIQRIPVELPDYVADDVKRRALDGHCSARHIIMRALRAYGVHIADEDMPEDGRRLR